MEAVFNSRRGFLKKAGVSVAALMSPREVGVVASMPNPVGYATISWPAEEFDHALASMSDQGFSGVQMLGWIREKHEKRPELLLARLESLQLKPVALSCSGVIPRPGGAKPDLELFRSYASFFHRLGGLYLQITDGGKPDVAYSNDDIRQLGAEMNELGRVAHDYGLTLGYHPHTGMLGETREGIARVFDATDERYVKLIADTGHIMLGGSDPAEIVRTYGNRLLFLHFKDARKDVAEAARADRSTLRGLKYRFCEIGTGAVDFPAIVKSLREVKFTGWIIVELDGSEPIPGGPDASARVNREALRKLGF